MRKLVRLALVASILYGTGAHWSALQLYAWSTMRAAGRTDSCKVCRLVEKGSAQEAPAKTFAAPSLDLAVSSAPVIVATPSVSRRSGAPLIAASIPARRPPTPPPGPLLPA